MKQKILSSIAAALLAGAYFGEVSYAPVYVSTGTIRYSQGKPITSQGFYRCSAVILYENNRALYAHTIPGDLASEANVCIGNVVEKILNKAQQRGFKLEQSFAVINAGSEVWLAKIETDFKKHNIPVRYASTLYQQEAENRLSRKVSYDPQKNKLEIQRGSERTNIVLENIVSSSYNNRLK